MTIRESQTLASQAIHVWGIHCGSSVTTHIAIAQIVGVNDHDIRWCCLRPCDQQEKCDQRYESGCNGQIAGVHERDYEVIDGSNPETNIEDLLIWSVLNRQKGGSAESELKTENGGFEYLFRGVSATRDDSRSHLPRVRRVTQPRPEQRFAPSALLYRDKRMLR